MKQISKGYYAVAALLLFWAAVDFYHYFEIGRDMISFYQGTDSVRQLVENQIVEGIVKILLAFGIITVGWIRAKRKNQPIGSLTAVTMLLSALLLTLWAASMGLLTAAAAEYGAYQVQDASENRASDLSDLLAFHLSRWDNLPNGQELAFWETLSSDVVGARSYGKVYDDYFLLMWDHEKFYTASAIYDREGNLLATSWQDSMYLQYMSEEEWDAGEALGKHQGIALLDRECLTEQGQECLGAYSGISRSPRALRLTGAFDGTTFLPARIEGVLYEDVAEALRKRGSGSYILSQVIEGYDLPWQLLYEDPEVPETVTFYADYYQANWREDSPAFFYRGERYPNLVALVEELGPSMAAESPVSPDQYQWRDLGRISVSYCTTYEGETSWNAYYAGKNGYQGEAPEVQYYLVSMVYASPLRNAFWSLWKIYAWTFVLAAVLILAGRTVLRRQLIRPAQSIGKALLDGSDTPDRQYNEAWRWREGSDLLRGFLSNRDRCQGQKNEINRLNTALTYAKTAEENRRQMTSSIAHELKTPLAVVHSYAEGLKEHIAEEKRDKYLSVILSETERMDAMVLEMLDLSRLEAGKIKLARDEFDLAQLTRSIWERLSRTAGAKDLHVTLRLPETCPITADEGRIGQVVENFISNAVKYTPAGGNIAISIEAGRQKTGFFIRNDCPPLSEEALSKVWDTFYRADEARSGGGTGLGLAIAKSIIELHGGRCSARSTETGVMFSFSL